jgi:hypothetical protein
MSTRKAQRPGFLERHYYVFLLWLAVAVMAFHWYVFDYNGTWHMSPRSLGWIFGAFRISLFSIALLSLLRGWAYTRIFVLLYWMTALSYAVLGLGAGYLSTMDAIISLCVCAFAGGMLYLASPPLRRKTI